MRSSSAVSQRWARTLPGCCWWRLVMVCCPSPRSIGSSPVSFSRQSMMESIRTASRMACTVGCWADAERTVHRIKAESRAERRMVQMYRWHGRARTFEHRRRTMEGVRKWGIPAVLIGAGVLLLLTGLIRGSGPWTLMGAGLTLLAGVLALMLAMHRLDRRTGLTLGVLLLLATVLLGWRNVRSVARSNEFAAAVAERNALVVQSLKDVRTVQLGYRQAYGHFTADVDALRQFVQHGHVPLVFKTRVSGTP